MAPEDHLIVEFVPTTNGCKRWAWKLCDRTQEQPVDNKRQQISAERTQEQSEIHHDYLDFPQSPTCCDVKGCELWVPLDNTLQKTRGATRGGRKSRRWGRFSGGRRSPTMVSRTNACELTIVQSRATMPYSSQHYRGPDYFEVLARAL